MATSVEIIMEKTKKCLSLWDAKQYEEVVTEIYATDASVVNNGTAYNGHEEIKKLFGTIVNSCIDFNPGELSVFSDDTIEQIMEGKCDGKTVNFKLTWKKFGDDWKIVHEEWA